MVTFRSYSVACFIAGIVSNEIPVPLPFVGVESPSVTAELRLFMMARCFCRHHSPIQLEFDGVTVVLVNHSLVGNEIENLRMVQLQSILTFPTHVRALSHIDRPITLPNRFEQSNLPCWQTAQHVPRQDDLGADGVAGVCLHRRYGSRFAHHSC